MQEQTFKPILVPIIIIFFIYFVFRKLKVEPQGIHAIRRLQ